LRNRVADENQIDVALIGAVINLLVPALPPLVWFRGCRRCAELVGGVANWAPRCPNDGKNKYGRAAMRHQS
jgi:hypothetical protein